MDFLSSIVENIIQIPIKIYEFFKGILDNIMLSIVSIPENIYNLFKPDTDVIQQHIDDLEFRIKSVFNIQNFDLGSVFGEADRPHVKGYNVKVFGLGQFNMPDIDFSWLELALKV